MRSPEHTIGTARGRASARRWACLWLALAASLLAGCSEPRPPDGTAVSSSTRPAAPASAAGAAPPLAPAPGAAASRPAAPGADAAPRSPVAWSRVGTMRVIVLSPPDPARREPTASYPSLEAARDTIEVMLRRAVNPADTAIHFSRRAVTFDYLWVKGSAPALQIAVVVTDTSACPHDRLMEDLRAAGWADDIGYCADGPDGGVTGFVSREFLCVIEGRWDGGDDSDSTYVPAPGCEVTVTCVPRRADDVPHD